MEKKNFWLANLHAFTRSFFSNSTKADYQTGRKILILVLIYLVILNILNNLTHRKTDIPSGSII